MLQNQLSPQPTHRYNLRKRKFNQVFNEQNDNQDNSDSDNEVKVVIQKIKKPRLDNQIDEIKQYANIPNYKLFEKIVKIDNKIKVKATGTANYLINDPILDWLETYYFKIGFGPGNPIVPAEILKQKQIVEAEKQTLINTLFKGGHEFESKIFKYLDAKFPGKTTIIVDKYAPSLFDAKFEETKNAIKKGIPIIQQALLKNPLNNTYGIADLLVRNDYLDKLVSIPNVESQIFDINNLENVEEAKDLSKFSYSDSSQNTSSKHYVVIDIKWSTLNLCANGENILNSDRYPAYKGQLLIYNVALGLIQNYFPKKAYIMGKGFKYENKGIKYNGSNPFALLGHIDYENFDNKYIDLTYDAIKWQQDLHTIGNEWNLLKPHRWELYPNMCNTNDSPYTFIKKNLANKLSELTSIYRVGFKNRMIGFSNDIYSWKDKDCSSEKLGINGKKVAPIVDNIIKINRDSKEIISPRKIKNNLGDWQNMGENDFFIDFETVNDMFYQDNVDIKNTQSNTIIFMIGIGYLNELKKFTFKEFHLDNLTFEEEKKMIVNFMKFIKKRVVGKDKIKVFHWSHAEETILELINKRYNYFISDFLTEIQFIDMYKVFVDEPIVIKGAMKYKLKEIGNAMFNHGLIKTKWSDEGITNGFEAMIEACNYYKSKNKNESKNHNLMNEIIKYNEIDCKVLYEIVEYLRDNLIKK